MAETIARQVVILDPDPPVGDLYFDLLNAMLEEPRPPEELTKAVKLEATEENLLRVTAIVTQARFHEDLARARADIAGAVVERIKRRLPRYVRNMEEIADQTEDQRVRFQANKDLLDRGGTAPAMRLDVGVTAFEKKIGHLMEDEPEEPKALSEGNGNAGTADPV